MTVLRWLAPWLPLALSLTLLGCPPAEDPGTAGQGPTGPGELNLLIYSEYIPPELLEEFQRRSGAPVRVSLFEGNEEMMQKLQLGGGKSQFDLVVASNQLIKTMGHLGLIQKLDHARLKNLGHLAPRFKDPSYDPGCAWSVPYQWGSVGVLYDAQKLPQLAPTWKVLFEQPPGSFVLIDEMRDQLGAALISLGHSVNTTDPAQVKAAGERVLAAKQRPQALGFEGGVGGKNKVLGGAADLAVVWNGDAVRAIEESQGRLAFVIPEEGSIGWVDCMVIPAEAPRPDLAHAFIDFILEPEVGAKLSNFTKYATPNQAALPHVREADRQNPAIYPSEATQAKLEYLVDLGADQRLYDEVWTAVKSR